MRFAELIFLFPIRVAGLPMQSVVFCGERMGVPSAETWDIEFDLRSYIGPDERGG
jgi:hypothetical protein